MTLLPAKLQFFVPELPALLAYVRSRVTRKKRKQRKTWQPQGPRFSAKAKIKLALCSIPSAARGRKLLDWGRMTIDDGGYGLGTGRTLD